MASRSKRPELVVIVGPTASGKSELAMQLAKLFNGEIIAADSRTIYKDMNIGTAKPTPEDQLAVPHWGIDLVSPGQRYTAFEFKQYALSKIREIQQRGHLPILVGGTGLYVDSVIFDYGFRANPSSDPANPRHRLPGSYERDAHLRAGTLVLGLDSGQLKERIRQRAENMFRAGALQETQSLLKKYGKARLAKASGNIYKICLDQIEGSIDLAQAVENVETADWQYARRQRTWFKRNKHISWFSDKDAALEFIAAALSK